MDNTGNPKTGTKKCLHEYEFYSYCYGETIYKCIFCNKSLMIDQEEDNLDD